MEDQADRAVPTPDVGSKDGRDAVSKETDSRIDGAHPPVEQDLERQDLRTDALDESVRSLDTSQSSDGSRRRRKHKKHRQRHKDEVGGDDDDATGGGDVGNSEDNEDDSSGDGGNVVVSSSIRRKRTKSGRHHKQKHSATNGEPDDSGLSLGNSMNDTSIRDVSQDIKTESAGGNDGNEDDRHTNPAHEDSQGTLDVTNNGADVVVAAADVNSAPERKAASENGIPKETHERSYATAPERQGERTAPLNEERSDDAVKEVKKAARHHRKLERQKTQYELEKMALKKRLDDTKTKFQEEISKYEKDLSEQRQQYLSQLNELRLQEQYDSLSVRFTDLTELEGELDRRFEECVQRQVEIEEFERFLNIREELCKNKESDLIKLDDELDAWQGELDIKRRQLELEDRKGPRAQTVAANTSFVKPTTDEEDYILKANLRKCQNDLTQAEENNATLTRECQEMKKQLECHQLDRRKQEQKIKQLESQLAIALSQLNNNKQSANHHKALPPINGHSTASFSRSDDRATSERSHVMLQRLNASAELSINQEAAIRRKLAGKDARSAGSSSAKTSRLNPRDGGTAPRHQSMSTGSSHSGEGGSTSHSPGASIMIGSPKSSPSSSGMTGSDHDHTADKSTVCLVM